MTIFDVIRYPISDIPTLEQLQALPEEMYNKWLIEVFNLEPDNIMRRDLLAYSIAAIGHPKYSAIAIPKLREIIKHHDTI